MLYAYERLKATVSSNKMRAQPRPDPILRLNSKTARKCQNQHDEQHQS